MATILNKDEILSKIYYNPKNPSAFSSVDKLYKTAKIKIPSLKRKYVENWLQSQETYTLYKSIRKKFLRNPMVSRHIDQWWQTDLVDISNISKYNNDFKFISTACESRMIDRPQPPQKQTLNTFIWRPS